MRDIAKNQQTKILKEQFIPDNIFLYVARGAVSFFDGDKSYTLNAGECGIARKNRLFKYLLLDSKDEFEPIIFCFDQEFLKDFQKRHQTYKSIPFKGDDAFIAIQTTDLLENFILSLKPYHKGVMLLDEAFEDLKYEELLIILLKTQPTLADALFDFGIPQKINLEAFMNRNYKFNVRLDRFAFLTGRSLSSFKTDFKKIFNETPNKWLVKKRLQEAYLLINQEHKTASEIYLDLGFEDLSHFSFAFKKMFGVSPNHVAKLPMD